MTLAKVILITAGSIIVLYLLWQLVALPLIGWVIDLLTFSKKPSKTNFGGYKYYEIYDDDHTKSLWAPKLKELQSENERLKDVVVDLKDEVLFWKGKSGEKPNFPRKPPKFAEGGLVNTNQVKIKL